MHRRSLLLAALIAPLAATAQAAPPVFTFPSIDGGTISSRDWAGHPVLVTNTASLCGFAPQLEGLQALHERLGPKGLIVLAVPSDDFAQELETGAKVKEYCTLKYGITLPMTDILPVAKGKVHPFYAWVAQQTGFVPNWNFNKVLIGPDGSVVKTWRSFTTPGSRDIAEAVAPFLKG